MKRTRVIVLMGGKTSEHEVSLVSGAQVVKNLDPKKFEPLPVVISKDGQKWQTKSVSQLLSYSLGILRTSETKDLTSQSKNPQTKIFSPQTIIPKADVVFIAMHRPFGEDGTVQGMLELAGIPYTGAGVLASALKMDKPMFKKIMEAEKIRIPRYLVLERGESLKKIWENFSLPVVVKPSSQGSSVGVSIVRRKDDLVEAIKKAFVYGPRIIIEEYLKGKEVTCGVLGNNRPVALPLVEIAPKKEFFDYEAKYVPGMCEEIVPARISEKLTEQVKKLAIKVYKAISCRGFGRVDMIICKGKPYVLEINTIPGLTPNSLFPKAAAAAGISYPQMLEKIIEYALEK